MSGETQTAFRRQRDRRAAAHIVSVVGCDAYVVARNTARRPDRVNGRGQCSIEGIRGSSHTHADARLHDALPSSRRHDAAHNRATPRLQTSSQENRLHGIASSMECGAQRRMERAPRSARSDTERSRRGINGTRSSDAVRLDDAGFGEETASSTAAAREAP